MRSCRLPPGGRLSAPVDSLAVTPPSPESLPAGTRLAHYELRRMLGRGAMGAVYEAHDTSLDRSVAIKVVHSDLASDPEVAARFLDEPRAAARVVHDNLTHVYFVGTTGGRPFYAMELVPGETLEAKVERDGPLALDRAVDVLVQTARGLAAAHEVGLVHRDVKPGNLIVTPAGRVKVTDFGLSKSIHAESGSTQVGALVGTPDYMSPEQCRGRPVDARSDVYSLGLTGYFLLTGRPPWSAASLGDLLDQQMNARLPSVRERRPELPAAADDVLARLTAKDPAARPAGMAEVVRLLESLRPRRVVPAPFVARGTALVLDLVLFAVAVTGAAAVLGVVEAWFGARWIAEYVDGLVAVGILLLLWLGMERRYGASVGKLLLHLEVVRDDGTRPDFATLAKRLWIRVPLLPAAVVPDVWLSPLAETVVNWGLLGGFAAGFVCYVVTRGRSLSDVLTRTRVAYTAVRA
jgi:uncharacterized RDD family membrane protein YckC